MLSGRHVSTSPSATRLLRLILSLVVASAPIHGDLSPEQLVEGPGKGSLTTGESADTSMLLGCVPCSVSLCKASGAKENPVGLMHVNIKPDPKTML